MILTHLIMFKFFHGATPQETVDNPPSADHVFYVQRRLRVMRVQKRK